MKITAIETCTVSAGWKNWLLLRLHTDSGLHGIGEGTLNGFIRTTETAVRELEHLAIGQDPRQVNRLSKRLMDSVSLDGGHIHRTAVAAIEVACWDILGKVSGLPVCELMGGRYAYRDAEGHELHGYPLYRAISQRSPEEMVANVAMYVSQGYKKIQLKVGGEV